MTASVLELTPSLLCYRVEQFTASGTGRSAVLLALALLAVSHRKMWCMLLPAYLTDVTHGSQQSEGKLRGHLLVWEVVRLRRVKHRCQTLCSSGRAAKP